ncbi:ATP-binding cassette domain-containing protein [Candidatus Desantisbacteria bacterium]|nr:ATP-binding cassette domain-containing protein [Candidatus Desantisbacteria bacterium]
MIKIEELTKYYDNVCAVDKISFEIKKGEILGLLGPNGAGKTTTLRILTCYMQPTSGNVSFENFNIYDNSLEIKKMVGYLPESAPIYPDMLVYDYLNFVADVRGVEKTGKEKQIKELADLCGINEVMHKPVIELSKGYKQRVGLAHAMMNNPEILVLDEPTSGLDPNQIIDIRNIIREIGKKRTVIFSTHILSEAEATCDRIIIINKGKIVADGSTEQLKEKNSSDYLIHISLLNAEFNDIKKSLNDISEIKDVVLKSTKDKIVDFNILCKTKNDIRSEIYKKIKNTDSIILEFHTESRTLETIFRELTRES